MDKVYETEHTVQMHTHPCYELTYYADGTGATEVEGEKFRFISGTFILAAPNAPHTETHKDRVAVVCVGFDTSTPLPSRLFVDKDRRVADTLRIIGRELKEKKLYYPSALDALSELLVLNVLRSAAGPARMSMDFDHVLNYITAHANETTNIKKIAAELHYNYDYFRQNFFARMGVSATDYLQKTKLSNAKNICSKANFPLRKSPAERALPPLRISAALSRIPKDSPPRSTARKTSSPNFPTFISRPLKNGRNRRDKNNAVKTLRLRHKYFKPSRCPRNICAGVAFTAFLPLFLFHRQIQKLFYAL